METSEEPLQPTPDNCTPSEECVSPEQQDSSEESVTPAVQAAPDIDRLVAEAEQRGYLRGRNEAISETMTSRPLWENSRLAEARAIEQPDPASLFLSRIRPDVWD